MCIVPITSPNHAPSALNMLRRTTVKKKKSEVSGRPHAHFQFTLFPKSEPEIIYTLALLGPGGSGFTTLTISFSFPLKYVSLTMMAPQLRYQLFCRRVINSFLRFFKSYFIANKFCY